MGWVTLAHNCFHHTIDIFIMLLFPVASIIFTALFLHNDILSEADSTEMASINMEDEHKPHRVRVIF